MLISWLTKVFRFLWNSIGWMKFELLEINSIFPNRGHLKNTSDKSESYGYLNPDKLTKIQGGFDCSFLLDSCENYFSIKCFVIS